MCILMQAKAIVTQASRHNGTRTSSTPWLKRQNRLPAGISPQGVSVILRLPVSGFSRNNSLERCGAALQASGTQHICSRSASNHSLKSSSADLQA